MKRHWLQFVAQGILGLFMLIMIYVTFIAYMRRSGFTGQDMGQIYKIRHHSTAEPL